MKLSRPQQDLLSATEAGPREYGHANRPVRRTADSLARMQLVTIKDSYNNFKVERVITDEQIMQANAEGIYGFEMGKVIGENSYKNAMLREAWNDGWLNAQAHEARAARAAKDREADLAAHATAERIDGVDAYAYEQNNRENARDEVLRRMKHGTLDLETTCAQVAAEYDVPADLLAAWVFEVTRSM